jgi:outer membrane receptor for ferrienterochelin and colicins
MNSLLKNYSNYVPKVVMAYDNDYNTTRSLNTISVSDRISDRLSYDIVGAYTWFGRSTDYITSDLYLLTKEITKTTSTVFNNYMTRGNFTLAPPEGKVSFMAGWDINYDNGYGDKIADSARIGDYAIYVSSQYAPWKKLTLQPGIRFIYNTIYGAPVIPSFNLQWTILENLGFRVSYARGFRAPSLKELYLDFKDSNHDLSGNKDLKAETTNSFNASLTYTPALGNARLKVEPSVFYNNGKDAITLIVTDAESNSATNVNLGGRRTLGGEVNATFRHMSGLSLGAGFSRIGETFDSEGEGDYLPLVFYSNFSFNSMYTFRKLKAVLMANLKYYGETPSLAMIPENEGGGYYRVFTDPYGDLEATFSKSLLKDRLNVVIGGKNLLNNFSRRTWGYQDYGQPDYQYEYLGPLNYGRTFFVKVNVKFIR